jgi:hypothetical protein
MMEERASETAPSAAPPPLTAQASAFACGSAANPSSSAGPLGLVVSHAQLGQDERVAALFGGKRGGTFVDVGASDGVRFSELAILRGLEGSRYTFKVIHVEHNYREPRRSELRAYLKARGYQRTAALSWDDEYTLRET